MGFTLLRGQGQPASKSRSGCSLEPMEANYIPVGWEGTACPQEKRWHSPTVHVQWCPNKAGTWGARSWDCPAQPAHTAMNVALPSWSRSVLQPWARAFPGLTPNAAMSQSTDAEDSREERGRGEGQRRGPWLSPRKAAECGLACALLITLPYLLDRSY